ncbi:MAG TPA: serine/threonine-protein kinase, partial [Thermoanaerobaculia bacterium]|nr:serine/threonine-protein kinase [Thermoanaerobaculia bacterium]
MSEAKRPPEAPTETAILPFDPALPSGGAPEGTFLGAYRVESLLGKGGMGEVFLAWDDRLKRRVAIKRIRRDSSSVSNLSKRFLQEAQAAAGLNHPAIVQVHDLLEDASGVAIVMEHVEGRTLAEHLSDGPLELPLALRLAREVAEGLAAAHAAGIVHRDLKAGNVIVTPAGHAKILDFGLARRVSTPPGESLTQHGVVLGTYHAMSPEQASGREVDARSDLFSCGVLLYEMLTGRSPFLGTNALDTLKRLATVEPPPVSTIRPEVPARLSDLIERLLEKDPDDRPGSAAEVAAALGANQAGTSEDPRPSAPRSPGLPSRMAVAALLAAVLTMSGTAWVLLHRPAESLRVLVQQPEVKGDDPRLALAASGVLAASLNTLTALEGVAPLEPRQLAGTEETAGEAAKSLAADEVLVATVEGAGNLGRVTLRRVAGSEGRVLWTDAFDISVEARDLRFLADAVGSRLSRGYPDRELREESLELGARDEDYTAFLEIKRRVDSGKAQLEAELARLEGILRTSPRFLQAWIMAAALSQTLFESTREISYRDRALAFVRQARALAPDDPRPLQARFNIALVGDRPEIARETLAQLEE